MSGTYWLRFSEDSGLPSSLPERARERLDRIFDPLRADSPWSQALASLGLEPVERARPLRWVGDVAYVNWSLFVSLVSQRAIELERKGTGFVVRTRLKPTKLAALMRGQWKLEGYIERALKDSALRGDAALARSLALGLAMLALTLRLPRHSEQELARWLALPGEAPRSVRATVERLKELQLVRTRLSAAWAEALELEAQANDSTAGVVGPPGFWDEPPDELEDRAGVTILEPWVRSFKGLPVSPGIVEERALVPALDQSQVRAILLFKQARPESVEHYDRATALVFGEGGVLSHACSVARERGIPTVTGIGRATFERLTVLARAQEIRLRVDGAQGLVEVIESEKGNDGKRHP